MIERRGTFTDIEYRKLLDFLKDLQISKKLTRKNRQQKL